MNKKKIIGIIVGVVLVIGLVIGGIFLYKNLASEKPSEDATKFKEEYESLNSTLREGTNNTYSDIEIPEINPIKYVDIDEVIDLLDSEEAIIYVGANWCPWCRGAIGPLLDVAIDYRVKNVYYLKLDDEKSLYEVENNKAVMTREGTERYYKLLDLLNDYLKDYTLTGTNKKTIKTGEKRIYQPTIITVKNNEILKVDGTTITLDKDQTAYDKITDEQYKFYYEHFEKLIKEVYGDSTCGEGQAGCD